MEQQDEVQVFSLFGYKIRSVGIKLIFRLLDLKLYSVRLIFLNEKLSLAVLPGAIMGLNKQEGKGKILVSNKYFTSLRRLCQT